MSQTLNTSSHSLKEAFYALSIAQDVPDAKLLDDIVRRYPEFGEELTEFAIALAVDALRGERVIMAAEAALDPRMVSPAVSRAISHFQNRLYAVTVGARATETKPATANSADSPNPFVALPRQEFRALAERLNANAVFVGKLRDRQIDPRTMTPGFQRRVAEELKAPLEVVVAHFAASQSAPARQFFKAESKPSAGGQQTFEEAVTSCGLTEAQQQALLEL
ncbi:hypothetical protein [Bradyrhizobium sp. SZCCHNR2023]|uniref:hypothetical protein n=1 Tax=Bradyrhizobium sp. SZCCHNR2023 TaxID=3057380 RepID=UPI00291697D0|nr:hypothetical protein [Bradyrhizobium sp. SZCCHNR2023]